VLAEKADPLIVTRGVKSVYAVDDGDAWGLWFSMMNSAVVPSVMQLGVFGLTEQSGSAFTEEQGEPLGDVQFRIAPEVMS
jgi:hypothetical protein